MFRNQVLSSWNNLKEKTLTTLNQTKQFTASLEADKKQLASKAKEEIKFALHELVLTLSEVANPSNSGYETALDRYKITISEIGIIQSRLGVAALQNLSKYYYQPVISWLKVRAQELEASWE